MDLLDFRPGIAVLNVEGPLAWNGAAWNRLEPAKSDPFFSRCVVGSSLRRLIGFWCSVARGLFRSGRRLNLLKFFRCHGLENGIRSLFKFMQYRDCSAGICAQIAERLKDSHLNHRV
jgi:hypothetical protein